MSAQGCLEIVVVALRAKFHNVRLLIYDVIGFKQVVLFGDSDRKTLVPELIRESHAERNVSLTNKNASSSDFEQSFILNSSQRRTNLYLFLYTPENELYFLLLNMNQQEHPKLRCNIVP